jgi:hypothetical protein
VGLPRKDKEKRGFDCAQIAFSKKAEQMTTVPHACKPRQAGRACCTRAMIIPTLPRMLKEDLSKGFFLLTWRANQYKRHIGGSWYPVTFKACHYGLAGFQLAGFRVRPE